MISPMPPNESERIEALRRYRILDTDAEKSFDEITSLAAQICKTPIALISLVDTDRQWFKARIGLTACETPRDKAFCAHAIMRPELFVVPDALDDSRFVHNSLVTDDPNIRFYAGAPLITRDGHTIGTLCVLDRVPRELNDEQRMALRMLAHQTMMQLELRRSAADLAQLNEELDREVVERKRTEEEIRFRAHLLNVVEQSVIATDMNGTIIYWNKHAETLYGWPAAEALGRNIMEVTPADTTQKQAAEIMSSLSEGQSWSGEFFVRRRDGTIFPVQVTDSPVYDDEGSLIGVVGISADITERKRAEEERAHLLERERAARAEAEEANRAKDVFLATVSHELRTPLTAILGYIEMINMGMLDEAGHKRAIMIIERNAKSQAQLVKDILDVSRIISGKMRLDVRPLDLHSVIEEAVDVVRPAIDAKKIELHIALAPNEGLITGDPDRLQQVVWNLLSNAAKFTPEQGRINLAMRRAGRNVEISVGDNGAGIPPDFLPYVFDRFRQAADINERLHRGLGLGLSIVRHLVELHGGTVKADSPGEGQGSTFTVKLPLNAAAPRSKVKTRRRAASGEGGAGRPLVNP